MFGNVSARLREHLEAKGKRAEATVVKKASRGTVSSSDGLAQGTIALKTTLRVHPVDEPEFEVRKTFKYPQLAVPPEGSRVGVVYDPADHDKIMLDDSPQASQSAAISAAGLDPETLATLTGAAGQAVPMAAPAAQPNRVEQLEKLAAMKQSGALTEKEFEAEKARILGGS